MKKLLTNLLLAVLLISFISASPCNGKCMQKATDCIGLATAGNCNVKEKETAFEIYPLDILSFKFQ